MPWQYVLARLAADKCSEKSVANAVIKGQSGFQPLAWRMKGSLGDSVDDRNKGPDFVILF